MAEAVCHRCGADKEVPLARCGACGVVPTGDDRILAMICSTRILPAEQLGEVAARLRKGEPINPSRAMRENADAILTGGGPAGRDLRPVEVLALTLLNVLFTPLLGYAAWFTWRRRPGRAAQQALIATVPISVALLVAWLMLITAERT